MTWEIPRDPHDPDRFYSGDAIKDYVCTLNEADTNAFLETLDVEQLRPYVAVGLLQMTYGFPALFRERVAARVDRLFTEGAGEQWIQTALQHAGGKNRWIQERERRMASKS